MKTQNKLQFAGLLYLLMVLFFAGCGSSGNKTEAPKKTDSIKATENPKEASVSIKDTANKAAVAAVNNDVSKVMIYNFHVTNRCASCIAIEEATTKTLKTYFETELKQGRVKRRIVNVDDEANQKIAEKYQAFGSGVFVTRIYKGKETTTDLTGDGFKFAKNKEERFIEILKNKILEYLK